MKQRIVKEIEEFHQFLSDWLSGKVDNTDENFSYLEKSFSHNFRLIHPNGTNYHRAPLLIKIKNDHGNHQGLTIETKNIVLRFWKSDYVLAIFETIRTENSKNEMRISTVIFHQNENNPNGLEWVQVHETWLPIFEN